MADDPSTETMERLSGYFTLALTVAARVAEVELHRRAQREREAARRGAETARHAEQQLRAETTVARHQLRDVGRKEWWDKAAPEEVAVAYATARAYGQVDGELAGTARYMAEEIGKRYGVNADELVERTAKTEAWMGAVGSEAGMRASEQSRRAATERSAAAALTVEADVVDHVARVVTPVEAAEIAEINRVNNVEPAVAMRDEGAPTRAELDEERRDARKVAAGEWDAGGRRTALTERLEAARLPADAVTARMAADELQGRPASVTPAAHGHGKPPKARNVPAKGQERVLGR